MSGLELGDPFGKSSPGESNVQALIRRSRSSVKPSPLREERKRDTEPQPLTERSYQMEGAGQSERERQTAWWRPLSLSASWERILVFLLIPGEKRMSDLDFSCPFLS